MQLSNAAKSVDAMRVSILDHGSLGAVEHKDLRLSMSAIFSLVSFFPSSCKDTRFGLQESSCRVVPACEILLAFDNVF